MEKIKMTTPLVEMTCDELERYASNFVEWVDVCKGWRPEEQG